jgi:hypothetical protein
MGFWEEINKPAHLAFQPKVSKSDANALILCGLQGKTMSVSGDVIRIEKKGMLSAKREKTFPMRNISSVEIKEPGSVLSGYIQLSIAGGAARNSSLTLTGGTFDAAGDENSVVFGGKDNYQIALKIKAHIEEQTKHASNPPPVIKESIPDLIKKLSELKDSGILSDEEFQQKKRELLERM